MDFIVTDGEPVKHTNEELYHRQVELLKTFRDRNAISQEQYDKCYCDLTEKMRIVPSKRKDLK